MKKQFSSLKKQYGGMAFTIVVLAIFLANALTSCKKDEPETKTVTVHDTVKTIKTVHDTVLKTITLHDTTKVYVHDTTYIKEYGKTISGLATYKDYAGATTNAKGTVVTLYSGSVVDPNKIVAYTYADASGIYKFPFLIPNNYFIFATYNTENKNAREIRGVDFATNPGYAVTMGTVDLVQNIALVNYASTGTSKIALDTLTNLFRIVTLDKAHSRISFQTDYGPASQGAIFPGFFGALKGNTAQTAFNLTKFAFDETNVANNKIEGYVLMHERSTGEDGRDALGNCGSKALFIDTVGMTVNGVANARPETDTCKFIGISFEKYGKGYLCHGKLVGFLMHKGPGNGDPICPTCPADTALKFTGPYDVQRELPVDMYFEFGGKQFYTNTDPTKAYYGFPFEGVFTFDKTKFNIKHASIGDMIKVSCHVNIKGTPGKGY